MESCGSNREWRETFRGIAARVQASPGFLTKSPVRLESRTTTAYRATMENGIMREQLKREPLP
jgi:hypothetical protein